MRAPLIQLTVALMAAATAYAEEKAVPLMEARGQQVVEGNCGFCHSLDYLRTNSPFLDRKGWQAEVNKMIGVFGAAVTPDDAKMVVDYLTKNYGIGG